MVKCSEMAEMQAVENIRTMDLIVYIASGMGIVVSLVILAFFSFSLCKFFRRSPKKSNPPPSPLCKRQMSVHAAYPPTPHIVRLPPKTRDASSPESPVDKMVDLHLPSNYQNKRKQSSKPRPLKKLASFTRSLSWNSSSDSIVIPMPSPKQEDVTPIHGAKSPLPVSAYRSLESSCEVIVREDVRR